MNIAGKFSMVSVLDDDGPVLVGFVGNVYPNDLSAENVNHIKCFYNRGGWLHRFCNEWPEGIEPAYPAAKTNFKNGFMLIYQAEG